MTMIHHDGLSTMSVIGHEDASSTMCPHCTAWLSNRNLPNRILLWAKVWLYPKALEFIRFASALRCQSRIAKSGAYMANFKLSLALPRTVRGKLRISDVREGFILGAYGVYGTSPTFQRLLSTAALLWANLRFCLPYSAAWHWCWSCMITFGFVWFGAPEMIYPYYPYGGFSK